MRDVREAPAKLIGEPGKELKSFTVACTFPMGAKRGAGRGGFIDSVLHAAESTYEDIGQALKPWSAAPPRLRSQEEVEVDTSVDEALVSTALSSMDEEFS